jgi:trigger factor
VAVSDEAKKAYKTKMLKQFGKLENTDPVKEEDFIIADLEQGENKVEGTYITLRQMAEEAKGQFLGKKPGESFEVNVHETFVNETDRATLLKVKKEELASVEPMWKVTVKEVKTFVEAEQTQEIYDRMFGEGVVTDEAGFEAKVAERIALEYKQESDFRFVLDAREYLLNKTNIELPEEFMKRWLFTINEGKFTMEDIEKDFALFCKDFRWQMISQYIMREQKMEITREEVLAVAKQMAKYQFAMYGLNDVPQEQLDSYAEAILANEKEGRRIVEKTEQDKVIGWVKSVVTLDEKEISIEDLQAMNN